MKRVLCSFADVKKPQTRRMQERAAVGWLTFDSANIE